MTTTDVKTMIEDTTVAPVHVETPTETIVRLSILPPLEYEQVREKEAERLGVRVSVLDAEVTSARRKTTEITNKMQIFPTVELWSEPVDGATLLNEIHVIVRRFIICEPEIALATALWIVFTWFIDHVQVAPLAVITSPEKRCGKSQLLNLIGRLSRRPLVASNISSAAVFRVIEAHSPTMVLDEADSFFKENEELRGVVNSGHTRQSAYVIRTVGEDFEPKQFSTWGAKAISGIGTLSETLMDRAIILELRRKLPHEKVDRLRHAEAGLFERLASMLARWSEDSGPLIERARPALPEALNDRAQDNWEPLLAIADYAGGDWPEIARKTALNLSGAEQEAVSLSAELLADIRDILDKQKADRIPTGMLLSELVRDDEAPWATYNRGKPMSPRQLAKRLGEYAIKPTTLRIAGIVCKGYSAPDFTDAFARYLIPSHNASSASVTAKQSKETQAFTSIPDVTDHLPHYGNNGQSVTQNALENGPCYAVTNGIERS